VLGVGVTDLWTIFALFAIVLISTVILYRPFLVISFDPVLAKTLRLPANLLRNIMLILLAISIVVSLQTVGIGLVAALLVTPAATAYLITRRLRAMMLLSAIFGAFSGASGLYLSYYLNIASGAAIVLVATAIFLIIFLFSPRKGVFWFKFRQAKSAEVNN
jgi:ABC-type Mn2+/Zn2+ transport system permease subunit